MKKIRFETLWKNKDIIRNIYTGKPLLVLHVFVDVCTLTIDLESKQSPILPFILLPRDYANYTLDRDMHYTHDEKWQYSPINL